MLEVQINLRLSSRFSSPVQGSVAAESEPRRLLLRGNSTSFDGEEESAEQREEAYASILDDQRPAWSVTQADAPAREMRPARCRRQSLIRLGLG